MNNPQQIKRNRASSILQETIARFVTDVANRDSFITVSYVDLNPVGNFVRAYCTVFPAEKEEKALEFLKRKERECKAYIKKHTSLRTIPTVRFFLAKPIN